VREICRFVDPVDATFGDGVGNGIAPSFGAEATVSRDAGCGEPARVFEIAFVTSRMAVPVARAGELIVGIVAVTVAATSAVAGEKVAGNAAMTGGAWACVAVGRELTVDSTDNDSTNTKIVAIARSRLINTKLFKGAAHGRQRTVESVALASAAPCARPQLSTHKRWRYQSNASRVTSRLCCACRDAPLKGHRPKHRAKDSCLQELLTIWFTENFIQFAGDNSEVAAACGSV
jgi:hypothetical protein